MVEPRLSFKEMCAKYDVTPRTLRYYEYIELLSPERVGRSRFYGSQRTRTDDADFARAKVRLPT